MEQFFDVAWGSLDNHARSVNQVGAEFKTIIPTSYEYQPVSIDQKKNFQLLTRDNDLLDDVEQFISCII